MKEILRDFSLLEIVFVISITITGIIIKFF